MLWNRPGSIGRCPPGVALMWAFVLLASILFILLVAAVATAVLM